MNRRRPTPDGELDGERRKSSQNIFQPTPEPDSASDRLRFPRVLSLFKAFSRFRPSPQAPSHPVSGADQASAAHHDLWEIAVATAHTGAGRCLSIRLSGSSRCGQLFTQVMPFLLGIFAP